MIKTIIFDLDDTLYNEIDYCRSGFRAVADFLNEKNPKVGSEQIFNELWRQFEKGNHSQTFNTAMVELRISYDIDLIKELVHIYREHNPDITLPQESKEVLETLKDKYTLALLSDGFLPAQKLKVQSLRIGAYFSVMVFTEELGRQYWKPSPVGYQKILDTLKIEASQAVYVSDNPAKDFLAPNQLGMTSIQLLNPDGVHKNEPETEDAAAKHKINSLTELLALLEKL
jgi:putative hydrolase of the HAD superfamily